MEHTIKIIRNFIEQHVTAQYNPLPDGARWQGVTSMTNFLRNSQFHCRPEQDGNYVVYNETSGTGYVMNSGSYEIWQLCDGTKNIETITSDLIQKRSSNIPKDIQEIVSKHIAILTAAGLVEKREN